MNSKVKEFLKGAIEMALVVVVTYVVFTYIIIPAKIQG